MLPYIPKVIAVQPVVIITGFLGAGKTTLLRDLLISLKGAELKCDVILNDYADAAMDSATLEQFANDVEPLTATCACCEGLDFLLELSIKSSDSSSELLFIELNGTADPVPIIESLTLLEEKLRLHPRWQVCVIDVRKFGTRGSYQDIEELQLQTATHIYFSHLSDNTQLESVTDKIKSINPYATIVSKDELTQLLVAQASKSRTKLSQEQAPSTAIDAGHISKSTNHQQTHEFNSCQILLPSHASEESIQLWLSSLPPNVIRVKLLIGITETPDHRYLYEKVGSEISPYTQRVKLAPNVPNSAILIGPALDTQKLEELAKLHFKKV